MIKTKMALAMALVLSLFAVSVANAGAVEFKAKTAKESVTSTGGLQAFTVTGGVVECTSLSGQSPVTTFPNPQLSTTMVFSGCTTTAFGFFKLAAKIVCAEFNFHSNGTVSPGECKIEVPSVGCKIITPAQGPLGTVTYTNASGSVTIKGAVTGIKYTASGCTGISSGTNGEYKGEGKAKGTNGASLEVA